MRNYRTGSSKLVASYSQFASDFDSALKQWRLTGPPIARRGVGRGGWPGRVLLEAVAAGGNELPACLAAAGLGVGLEIGDPDPARGPMAFGYSR